MSNVLGLLYEDGFDKINSLLEKQSDELRVPFYVRKDLSYIMGETYSSDAFPYKVYIGTNGNIRVWLTLICLMRRILRSRCRII